MFNIGRQNSFYFKTVGALKTHIFPFVAIFSRKFEIRMKTTENYTIAKVINSQINILPFCPQTAFNNGAQKTRLIIVPMRGKNFLCWLFSTVELLTVFV